MVNKDIFDKIMHIKILRRFEPLYTKNKEILLYLFFGAWTTIISFVSFWIATQLIDFAPVAFFGGNVDLALIINNVISWICAVTFSYVTARVWVFESNAEGVRGIFFEAVAFYGGRVFTLLVETVIMSIGVDVFEMGEMLIKILASIVVLILNYIISKLFIFNKKKTVKEDSAL